MTLIKGFRATNVWNAFILSSIVSAFSVTIALLLEYTMDDYVDKHGNRLDIKRKNSSGTIILTFITTFIASFLAYMLLYYVFGMGCGMLARDAKRCP